MRERDALLCDRLSRRLPIAVSIGIEGSIAFHNKLENAAQARMKKPRPTNDRGSACQTIWCRYASGIAGSMAPFSAKRKSRQSFAPQFVYPSKVQIKQMRGKLLPTSRVSCHRLPSVGKCSSAAQERAYAKTGPPFSTAVSFCVPAGRWPPGRDPRRPLSTSGVPANRRKPLCSEAQNSGRERPSRRPCPRSGEPHHARNQAPK